MSPAAGPTAHSARRALREVFGACDPLALAVGGRLSASRGRFYCACPAGGEAQNFVAGGRHDRLQELVAAGFRHFRPAAQRFSVVLCSTVQQPVRLAGWAVYAEQTVYRRPRRAPPAAPVTVTAVSSATDLETWRSLVERSFGPGVAAGQTRLDRFLAVTGQGGVAAAGLYPTPHARVLVDLCVDPTHRGRGHGMQFLAALAARVPADQPLYALADADASGFYARAGWQAVAFVQRLRCVSRLPMF